MTRTQQTDTHTRYASTRSRLARIALLGALVALALTATACSQAATPEASDSTAPVESQSAATTEAPDSSAVTPAPAPDSTAKLEIKDTKVGKGVAAKAGDTVTVDYTGWLMDGTQFDSSVGKQPFTFPLGAGQVIEGWDKGVVGMKVGGTRVLVIPSQMGYGQQGSPPVIPANATLKFEVKLLSVTPGP